MLYNCSLKEIFSIISHTPRLRHLVWKKVIVSQEKLQNEKPVTLDDLTTISFHMSEVLFDEFVIFLSKLVAPVQVLRIKYSTESDYLNADDWERLIRMHLPHLRTFDFEYHEGFITDFEGDCFYTKINGFTSQFWIKRQYFVQFAINMGKSSVDCSIHPYRYVHFEFLTLGLFKNFVLEMYLDI